MYEIRKALRRLYIDEWTPEETEGLEAGDGEDDIPITFGGGPNQELPYPQVTIRGTSGQGGPRGLAGDGTGVIYDYNGRADVQVWSGSYDTDPPAPLSSGNAYSPERIGSKIANHLRDITHDHNLGVPDPDTGEALTTDLEPLTYPFVLADPDVTNPQHFYATLEVGFELRVRP